MNVYRVPNTICGVCHKTRSGFARHNHAKCSKIRQKEREKVLVEFPKSSDAEIASITEERSRAVYVKLYGGE